MGLFLTHEKVFEPILLGIPSVLLPTKFLASNFGGVLTLLGYRTTPIKCSGAYKFFEPQGWVVIPGGTYKRGALVYSNGSQHNSNKT